MGIKPVDGVEWGTTLPFEDFPKDLRCPWCDSEKVYKSSSGLRGHAMGKHGIKWEKTPWEDLSDASKDLLTRGFSPAGLSKLEKLRPWHMIGLAMVEVQGKEFDEAAADLGRHNGGAKLLKVASSPAGQAYVKWLQDKFDSPAEAARAMLRSQAMEVSVGLLLAYQWAKEANDYDAVHRISRDLLKAGDVLDHDADSGVKPVIKIFVGQDTSLDIPVIETDWEELVDEDDED